MRLTVSLFCWNVKETAWKEKEPEERRIDFVPQRYSSLRLVPSYPRYVNELFERCLDLYLCPRRRKMRVSLLAYCRLVVSTFVCFQTFAYTGYVCIYFCIFICIY